MIYFLTRSLAPYQNTGGGLIRLGQVNELQKLGWKCQVVMPNYESNQINEIGNVVQIPFKKKIVQKFAFWFQRFGLFDDYLDLWVNSSFDYLKDKVNKNDIVFATSGGELGMLKLGAMLKTECSCSFVANFHDPLTYSLVNNLKLDNKFHVSRDKQEYKYIKNSDLIITSSNLNKESLKGKHQKLKVPVVNNYFGYISKVKVESKDRKQRSLKIAYVGKMGEEQQPELLYRIFSAFDKPENLEIYFIGNSENYKPLKGIQHKQVKFINYLPHVEFLEFMMENIDVGFVSLSNDYLGACVPSKIFEYINLEIPMIGALPDGDGKDIINDFGYGVACKYNDIAGLVEATKKFLDPLYFQYIKSNLSRDKDSWAMKSKITDVDHWLRKL